MLLHLIYFSGISMFFALFRLSVSGARPLSVSVALGLSIRFTGISATIGIPEDFLQILSLTPNFVFFTFGFGYR